MSPETQEAIAEGRILTPEQFMEYVDYESRMSGLSGADEAIARARADEPPMNYREMRVRMLVAQVHGG